MSDDVIQAGHRLADTLAEENAALTALDLPRAGAMLARKQRALADLAAAQAVHAPRDSAERMAKRLQGLALENKRLLERALAAQGRVIGVVAQAATTATPSGYGPPRKERAAAFALSARV
jgi:hypothetical protein